MELRPATSADLDAVLALDRARSPVFARCASYAAQLIAPHLLLVATSDGILRGFASWSTVLDEATLANIAVDPQCSRGGLGRHLIVRSRTMLAARGVRRLLLEVRESNVAARRLYEVSGFIVDGRREAYYPARNVQSDQTGASREAALMMSAAVPASLAVS